VLLIFGVVRNACIVMIIIYCCVCGMWTGLACQSCPQQFGTPWSLMKHAQNVHALKIYLEMGQFSSGVTEVNYYSEKPSASSEKNNNGNTEVLSYMPQQPVDLNGAVTVMLKNSLSSGLHVLPACNVDVATQKQFNNSELLQSSVRSDLSENFENMPPQVYTGQRKSLSVGDDESRQISGDLTSQTCTESCIDDVENVSVHSAVPEKCCSSVLPKKRKRHMEIKHGNSRKRAPLVSSGPTSIYIDLQPESEGHSFQASLSRQDPATVSESESSEMLHPSLCRRSVIIQPGMTFSIPVSRASESLAPSFSSAMTYSTSSYEQKSTDERHLQVSNPTEADTVIYEPVQELSAAIDEQKNSMDDSLHDGFIGEEAGSGKTLEHKRRRYPTSRPFKCDQCDNAFNQRIHLKKHQSKHTGNVVFIKFYYLVLM